MADYILDISKLPESLMKLKFKSRYSDPDSTRYAEVKDKIGIRIGGLTAYR